jgi:hypothetical protein
MDILTTELAFEALVDIGAPAAIGETALGRRRMIPITGGTFKGPRIEGEVVPGGADWQTVRADGVTVVEAIYALKASDGAVIAVRNLGIVAPIDGGAPYVRTTPSFDAPQGPHEWLNRNVFVGTIAVANAERTRVRISVYRVI